jgi:predicted DNA-binding transcriptional regulator AlpA
MRQLGHARRRPSRFWSDEKRLLALAGISRASWDRLSSAAKNPKPLKLGGRTLWRRSDLERWVALGLPDRKTFEELAGKLG